MTISFKNRFVGNESNGMQYAPLTLGAPCFTNTVDHSVFAKTVHEMNVIHSAKKKHNKLWRKHFRRKRVSAGIVKRYFLSLGLGENNS